MRLFGRSQRREEKRSDSTPQTRRRIEGRPEDLPEASEKYNTQILANRVCLHPPCLLGFLLLDASGVSIVFFCVGISRCRLLTLPLAVVWVPSRCLIFDRMPFYIGFGVSLGSALCFPSLEFCEFLASAPRYIPLLIFFLFG